MRRDDLGRWLLGVASLAAGVFDAIWGEFEPAHQPIHALGDHIPGVTVLAYVAAAWLIAGGAAVLWRRTARLGAIALAIVYAAFAAFWLPRFVTAPRVLGYRPAVYIGVLAGTGTQVMVVIAAAVLFWEHGDSDPSASRGRYAVRWAFGLCPVFFGLGHLTGIASVARMVPQWMPFGGKFWVIVTGIAFVLAGLGVLFGVRDVLAARLLALMLLAFGVLALPPLILAAPHDHVSWGANAYNLAAAAAAWIMAGWLARHPAVSHGPLAVRP